MKVVHSRWHCSCTLEACSHIHIQDAPISSQPDDTPKLRAEKHAPSLVLARPPRILDILPIATPPGIKLLAILIPHLPPTLPAPILPALRKPLVQIRPDDPLVQLGAADVQQTVQRVLMGVVLDEAEAAGGLVEAVEAHDEPLDLAAFGEELVDLLFRRVEGQVADVERRCVRELAFEVRALGAVGGVVCAAVVPFVAGPWVSLALFVFACGVGGGFVESLDCVLHAEGSHCDVVRGCGQGERVMD